MVSVKDGASIFGIRPEVVFALIVADEVYQQYGVDCVVTSGSETTTKHRNGSFHYQGLAVDLRTKNLPDHQTKIVVSELMQKRLGKEFDVVLEPNHIHLEYQKKK